MTARVVVAGMGSEYRSDDGAGPFVARRVAELVGQAVDIGPLGEPLDLLGRWDGAELAILVDATRSGVAPGSVVVHDLDALVAPRAGGGSGGDGQAAPVAASASGASAVRTEASTHGIGLSAALAIARVAGRSPRRVVVVGIEGREFGFGVGMSPAVVAALPDAVRSVLEIAGLEIAGLEIAGLEIPGLAQPAAPGLGP
ncbi:MAG: hypothetical protein ACYCR4_01765 [Acidimicrobiales bacterium]